MMNQKLKNELFGVIDTMTERFTSGNDIKVERTSITIFEWRILLKSIKSLSEANTTYINAMKLGSLR